MDNRVGPPRGRKTNSSPRLNIGGADIVVADAVDAEALVIIANNFGGETSTGHKFVLLQERSFGTSLANTLLRM